MATGLEQLKRIAEKLKGSPITEYELGVLTGLIANDDNLPRMAWEIAQRRAAREAATA